MIVCRTFRSMMYSELRRGAEMSPPTGEGGVSGPSGVSLPHAFGTNAKQQRLPNFRSFLYLTFTSNSSHVLRGVAGTLRREPSLAWAESFSPGSLLSWQPHIRRQIQAAVRDALRSFTVRQRRKKSSNRELELDPVFPCSPARGANKGLKANASSYVILLQYS